MRGREGKSSHRRYDIVLGKYLGYLSQPKPKPKERRESKSSHVVVDIV